MVTAAPTRSWNVHVTELLWDAGDLAHLNQFPYVVLVAVDTVVLASADCCFLQWAAGSQRGVLLEWNVDTLSIFTIRHERVKVGVNSRLNTS